MADFGGLTIETPQEVQQRIQASYQEGLQSNNVEIRRQTQVERAIDNLLGQPQVRKAENFSKALVKATADNMEKLGANPTPQQAMRARMDAAVSVSTEFNRPEVAMQAQQQLLQLDADALERSRLLAADERDIERHNQAITERGLRIKGLEEDQKREAEKKDYKVAVSGTVEDPQFNTFDLRNPESAAALEDFVETNPDAIVMDSDRAADLRYGERKNSVGVNEQRKVREQTNASLRAVRLGNTYLEILRANPDVFSVGSQVSAGAANFFRQVESLGGAYRALAEGNPRELTSNNKRLNAALDAENITNTRVRALAVNLAYALARQNDPGGRLSDNDIEFAMRMLGGNNPDPRAIAAALEDNVLQPARDHMDTLRRSPTTAYDADILAFEESMRKSDSIIQSFQLGDEDTRSTDQIIEDNRRETPKTITPTQVDLGNGVKVGFGN